MISPTAPKSYGKVKQPPENKRPSAKKSNELIKGLLQLISHDLTDLQLLDVTSHHVDLLSGLLMDKMKIKVAATKIPNTMCTYSQLALAILFSGKKEAQKMFSFALNKYTFNLSYELPSKKEWNYKVSSLFDGIIQNYVNSLGLSKLSDEVLNEAIVEFIKPILDNFKKHVSDSVATIVSKDRRKKKSAKPSHCKKALKLISYPFNKQVLENLKTDLHNNSRKMRFDNSAIYYVKISSPTEVNSSTTSDDHAFTIMQFFSPNKKTGYCILQSWIDATTLIDDIRKRGYGENYEGAMNEVEMDKFLDNFTKYCSPQESDEEETTSYDCFGYKADPVSVEFHKGKLSGTAIKYWVDFVDPASYQSNLRKFLRSHKLKT